ncbi:hypothetical protein VNO80_30456 [Phaseolus coccineus]|uniref:Uncharacterized protein n=1 Tax=Phaseolus coccineus TaxID=3886 RepID=A0AAN9QFU5_PHACN
MITIRARTVTPSPTPKAPSNGKGEEKKQQHERECKKKGRATGIKEHQENSNTSKNTPKQKRREEKKRNTKPTWKTENARSWPKAVTSIAHWRSTALRSVKNDRAYVIICGSMVDLEGSWPKAVISIAHWRGTALSQTECKKLAMRRSPEFVQGKKLTHNADLYCFGTIVLEIVTQNPWPYHSSQMPYVPYSPLPHLEHLESQTRILGINLSGGLKWL